MGTDEQSAETADAPASDGTRPLSSLPLKALVLVLLAMVGLTAIADDFPAALTVTLLTFSVLLITPELVGNETWERLGEAGRQRIEDRLAEVETSPYQEVDLARVWVALLGFYAAAVVAGRALWTAQLDVGLSLLIAAALVFVLGWAAIFLAAAVAAMRAAVSNAVRGAVEARRSQPRLRPAVTAVGLASQMKGDPRAAASAAVLFVAGTGTQFVIAVV